MDDIGDKGERPTVLMRLVTNGNRSRTLRFAGVADIRTFGEVGGDELRVIDVNELEGNSLEFGRYRLEWWYDGKHYISLNVDNFEDLG